jgi:hypothetical protein
VEVVLHEYSLTLVAEPDTAGGAVIRHIEARPSVLPFPECPAAAQAVASLTGENIDRFPSSVPELLTSVRSCTHLNDLLRSVGGAVPAMTARA